MFLSRRSTQAEYLDTPGRAAQEIAADYRELGRVNWLFRFSHPFEWFITRSLGAERCRRLDFLDLGAGDGLLGECLSRWAARRGWTWRFTNLDLNPQALQLRPGPRNIAGSVLQLPFADGSFDVVIASQMTHHLDHDAEVVTHFREAWRVTRDALLLCDTHRNAGLYGLVWVGTLLCGCSKLLRQDGFISVRRSFRVPEWQALAALAEIPRAKVSLYLGTRLVLQARKAAP